MTNPLHNAAHPIWPLLRLVAMLAALTTVLLIQASEFDDTELKTIISMFLIGAGVEGLPALLRGRE